MKLLTKAIIAALPELYTTQHSTDPTVHLKLFVAWGDATWFITEYDGKDTLYGYAHINGEGEMGYMSLAELEAVRGRLGLRVERDMHFDARPMSECLKTIHRGRNL
jgi:hypothetical protein